MDVGAGAPDCGYIPDLTRTWTLSWTLRISTVLTTNFLIWSETTNILHGTTVVAFLQEVLSLMHQMSVGFSFPNKLSLLQSKLIACNFLQCLKHNKRCKAMITCGKLTLCLNPTSSSVIRRIDIACHTMNLEVYKRCCLINNICVVLLTTSMGAHYLLSFLPCDYKMNCKATIFVAWANHLQENFS